MINRTPGSLADAQASIHKAVSLYHAGKVADAIKICRSVLRFVPKDADMNHLLAQILIYTGDALQAWPYLKTAIMGRAADDTFKTTYYDGLKALYADGKFGEMEEEALWLTNHCPDNGFAFDLLGAVRIQQKKYTEAFESLHKAQTLLPDNPHTLANYGYVLMEIGRNAEAVEVLRKSVRVRKLIGRRRGKSRRKSSAD